jgi:hypothetical protein
MERTSVRRGCAEEVSEERKKGIPQVVVLKGVKVDDGVTAAAKEAGPLFYENRLAASPRTVDDQDRVTDEIADDTGESLTSVLGGKEVML